MKKLFFVPALLLLFAGCGNLTDQLAKNLKLSNEIKSAFQAGSVNVSSSVTNGAGKLEIEISESVFEKSLSFDERRVAAAIAVFTKEKSEVPAGDITVKYGSGSVKNLYNFDEKLTASYKQSATTANAYLTAMLKKDKAGLLKNSNPEYLGESSMPQVTTLADELLALGSETSRQLAGIMDSNIDNTTIPVHVVTYVMKLSGGESRVCTFFVHSENDHKVAGFDIR
ncbi:MAG: hypothetical protein ACRC3B_22505 [Bacteroidia bacterium]